MPHRRHLIKPAGVAERGVYEHPFVGPDAERYLFAVDRYGRRVMEATVYPWTLEPHIVTEFLEAFLDQQDPPHLQLIP
jgi:hypothetical protein